MSKINLDRIKPDKNIKDDLEVPDKKIYLLTNHDKYFDDYKDFLEIPGKKRKWFTNHAYFCLPLSMGNQHGFIIKSMHDVLLRWQGRDSQGSLSVFTDSIWEESPQTFDSHFGSGIVTVQMHFTLRTPKGVNLMVKEPPNFILDGLTVLNAVVETDQLRRDFTYNIKVSEPNKDIFIPKGTPLASIIPYPRFFHDDFEVEVLKDKNKLKTFRDTLNYFNQERAIEYKQSGKPSLRYMNGEDIFGNEFFEHQKSLDGGRWWKKKHEKKS